MCMRWCELWSAGVPPAWPYVWPFAFSVKNGPARAPARKPSPPRYLSGKGGITEGERERLRARAGARNGMWGGQGLPQLIPAMDDI